ncbi:hypothetical protein M3Y94_00785600 [Aphelenchoides besseyi]|nr:hypothetical protein M3Y94_00785600 [Aphelenchoides besseyi]
MNRKNDPLNLLGRSERSKPLPQTPTSHQFATSGSGLQTYVLNSYWGGRAKVDEKLLKRAASVPIFYIFGGLGLGKKNLMRKDSRHGICISTTENLHLCSI